jgi:hypothetical protein
MEELKQLARNTNWTFFCQFFPIFIYLLSSKELKKRKDVILVLSIVIVGMITDLSPYHDVAFTINLYYIIYTILVLLYFSVHKPEILHKFSLRYTILLVIIIRLFLLYIDKPYTVNLVFLIINNFITGALLFSYFFKIMTQKDNPILKSLTFWTIFAYWIHILFYTLLAFRITPISTIDIDWVIIRLVGAIRCVFVCIGFLLEDIKIKNQNIIASA